MTKYIYIKKNIETIRSQVEQVNKANCSTKVKSEELHQYAISIQFKSCTFIVNVYSFEDTSKH